MRLYIAEKKDVATAIAQALGCQSPPSGAAYPVGHDRVTWLWGHVLKLSDPEDHNDAYKQWALTSLPMDWPVSYLPEARHKDHLKAVLALAKEADELVNAGDPDPEGQRLVDEVIEYGQLTGKPVKRVLINDNNAPAILKAIEQMEDNQTYHGLSMSALARAVCDQRYGYNLTRCYTLLGRQKGYDGVLSVGRVQTPILGLVVARDRAHEAHEKQAYYVVQALMDIESKSLTAQATYLPKDTDPMDEKKRLIDETFAASIVEAVYQKEAAIISVETVDKKRAAPLPYNLLALQADAAGKWKYSPKKVLEITQRLRDEHKAITYNRSDCRYLNEERHVEAGELLIALAHSYGELANNAQPTLKSKAFNSDKVTAHHAIIPTLSVPVLDKLSQEERRIYDWIARSYIAQFYPPETYRATTVLFECEGYTFKATGRVDVAPGWIVLYSQSKDGQSGEDEPKDHNERVNLESLTTDDPAQVQEAQVDKKFTQPLPRYTMKTLLKDLTRVSKYVTDPAVKALLLDKDADKQDEAGGIGTPATRDSHIETLFTRFYVEEKGKALISTVIGREFHDALPDFAVKPDLTALWHEKQKQIEAGTLDYQSLITEVDQAIAAEIQRVKGVGLNITVQGEVCPTCQQGVLKKRQGKKGAFWGCNRYPDCNSTFPDQKGQPDLTPRDKVEASTDHACPVCEKGFLQPRKGKKGPFWGCNAYPNCKTTFPDADGKPDLTPREKIEASSEHHCPQCQKPMARRPSKKKPGNYWWSCTGFPTCKTIAFDHNGVPEFKQAS